MNKSLSPAMRRALALVILLSLVTFFWSVAIRPLIAMSEDRRADIAELSDRLARLQVVIARRPELQRQLSERDGQLAAAGGLWRDGSATAIGAAVQDRLRKVVGDNGGQVESSSEARETSEHGFRSITVHFKIEGTLDTMTRTLAAIEAARPALFAERLTVAAPESPAADGPPTLHFEIDVSSYVTGPRP